MEKSFTPKAIALLSGGLDSALAARVIKDQGIEVIGLHLVSPFGCKNEVQKTADSLGINIVFKEKGEAYLDLVKSPQYGYGKNMNPCVDCRIYMFELAEQVMQEQGAHFIITGEVVGQRPMSQQKQAMQLIDKKSDSENRVLRPLSAHLFPPSLAEINGWVDREKLFGISGRSRTEQLEMAKNLGLENYAAPGGGCLLTESAFSNRLRDFFKHESVDISTEKRLVDSQLILLGRNFKVSDNCNIIIG